MRTNLDSEKELFLMLIWILPLVPQISIFLVFLLYGSFCWYCLMILAVWAIVLGIVYYCNHSVILFNKQDFVVISKNKKQTIRYSDISNVEEISHYNNPKKLKCYRIHIGSENKTLLIRNRKIQDQFNELFPNIKVKKTYRVD